MVFSKNEAVHWWVLSLISVSAVWHLRHENLLPVPLCFCLAVFFNGFLCFLLRTKNMDANPCNQWLLTNPKKIPACRPGFLNHL
jgi:hypothetical protein